jgi:hypothetical protein
LNNKDKIVQFLKSKPGYLKKSAKYLSSITGVSEEDCLEALKEVKNKMNYISPPRTLRGLYKIPESKIVTRYDPNNVIFIPDLHSPFIKDGVLDWILDEQKKYKAGKVIFSGDIVDGHAWSYHEHDVDGMSVGDELEAAKKQLKQWFKAFPRAISLLGNHDLLIQRKAKTAGLSKHFIRDFGDVVGAPSGWEFKLKHHENNVDYLHGSVGDAMKVAISSRTSSCLGHFHSKTFVNWSVSDKDAIFGLQVGWGADRTKYAFEYGKNFPNKPIISCGLILEAGRVPLVKLMPL